MSRGTQHRYANESSSYDESSDSLSDKRTASMHSVVQGSISNPVRRRDAVEPRQCQEGVKSAQLKNQALKERLRTIEEQNKVLSTNSKGRRKQDNKVSEDILAFGAELKICAKRYGLTINMFPPPAALLKVTLPNPVPPFNTAARYATTGSQEIATLVELYDTLPQHLHHLVPMNRFSHVFSKALCAGHASELNKLRSAAALLRDMEPEIRQLLGITGKAGELYPLLPPMLFPGNIIDCSRKTLFGNWQPIAKTLSCCLKGRTSLSNQGRRQGGAPPNAVKWGVTAVMPGAVAWAIVTNFSSATGRSLACLKGVIKNINNFVFERTSRPSHDLNIRDSAEDLEEEMCLARLGLAAEAGDSEDMSDHEEYQGDKNGASIDVLTEATGTITIRDPDEAPVPPDPMISTTDTMTSALTVSSNSAVITGSSPCVYDGPGDETEVVAIEETNIHYHYNLQAFHSSSDVFSNYNNTLQSARSDYVSIAMNINSTTSDLSVSNHLDMDSGSVSELEDDLGERHSKSEDETNGDNEEDESPSPTLSKYHTPRKGLSGESVLIWPQVSQNQTRFLTLPHSKIMPRVISSRHIPHTRNFWWSKSKSAIPEQQAASGVESAPASSSNIGTTVVDLEPATTTNAATRLELDSAPIPVTTTQDSLTAVVDSGAGIDIPALDTVIRPLQYGDLAELGLAGWSLAGIIRWSFCVSSAQRSPLPHLHFFYQSHLPTGSSCSTILLEFQKHADSSIIFGGEAGDNV
ncbi:uncharacterized protein F5147DRAFT_658284 [Suillus discolor]|uniref:Uncharacterized protein n=1 Tax=Suillus discolor TaxID=1912936 RepID=A0A9P7ETX3_9AGAM|nr:uncharacterized protein F5147DRAFT_658284 [Suillus discolor]KAG2090023.1 hypothetical protein F5147DRAFT_658284 [Suillus discolor]